MVNLLYYEIFDLFPTRLAVEKWTPLRSCPLFHSFYDVDDVVSPSSLDTSINRWAAINLLKHTIILLALKFKQQPFKITVTQRLYEG